MRQKMARLLRSRSRGGGRGVGGTAPAAETRQRYERDCAAYLAGLSASGGSAARTQLVAAIGTLLTPDAAGVGTAALPAGSPAASFDALLRAVDRALEVEGERENQLALALSDAAVTLRPRSKGAWRQRGRALEAAGQLPDAVTAYETYVTLEGAEARYVRRAELLGEQRAVLEEAAGLLPVRGAVAEEFAAAVAEGQPLPRVRTAFTVHLGEELAARGAADPDVRRLAALYSTHSRLLAYDPPADTALAAESEPADTVPFGVHDLRGYLAGRTVCVAQGVADVPVDAYDLVVRCDALPPEGARQARQPLQIHATTATRGHQGWGQHADVRLVLDESARPGGWQEAVRALVPGAQRYAGDGSLRRPLSDPALLGEGQWGGTPSTAFVMLRLLDFLDLNPRIDLIGPPLAGPPLVGPPPPGSLRPDERAWLRERTENSTGSTQTRISLR